MNTESTTLSSTLIHAIETNLACLCSIRQRHNQIRWVIQWSGADYMQNKAHKIRFERTKMRREREKRCRLRN